MMSVLIQTFSAILQFQLTVALVQSGVQHKQEFRLEGKNIFTCNVHYILDVYKNMVHNKR